MTLEGNIKGKLDTAVMELLVEQGLSATTYRSVADRVGCSRAVVQYYFPQKASFVQGFLEREAEEIRAYLEGHDLTDGSPVANAYAFFQIQFALQASPHFRAMATDVLASRELTSSLVGDMETWLSIASDVVSSMDSFGRRRFSLVLCGAYDLLYLALVNDEFDEVPRIVDCALQTLLEAGGYSKDQVEEQMGALRIPQSSIEDAVIAITKNLLE